MKGLISYLAASLILITAVEAQQQHDFSCGTEMPEEMTTWLKDYKQANPGVSSARKNSEPFYIPLKLHVVGTDAGTGYLKTELLLDLMCRINQQFEEVGMHFYIYDGFNYINDTELYNHDGNRYFITIGQEKVDRAANLFFVKTTTGGGTVGGGGTSVVAGYFSGFGDYIALLNSFVGPGRSTTSHELGHYFSLPHTFSGWENGTPNNPEKVDGSNCSVAGDLFCDTPPDYLSYPWRCPYNENQVDPNGTPIDPDPTLFMSYEGDDCKNRFSEEQMDAMRSYLIDERTDLLTHPKPLIADVEPTTLLYPAEGATGIPANYTQLKWDKVDGATQYHVFLTRFANPNLSSAEFLVEDTSLLLTDLEPDFNYRWKVRPFNPANTCADYTDFGNFKTSDNTSLTLGVDVDELVCPGSTDGYINVSVSGGTAPYTYEWEDGVTTANFRNNLEGGTYEITVTDLSNDSVVLSVDLVAPQPLTIELDNNNTFTLSSTVTGGTPPYSYNWSNGAIDDYLNLGDAGSYTLNITDANGCTASKSFTFTSIEDLSSINELKVYPNPLSGQQLSIDLVAEENMDATIELYDNSGRMVRAVNANFVTGANSLRLDMSNIHPGVYIVKILSNDVAVNRKVVVF